MNVAEDKVSRILWHWTVPKAVEIAQLAWEIGQNTEPENESVSENEEEYCFQEDSVAQEEVVLFEIDMQIDHEKGDPD